MIRVVRFIIFVIGILTLSGCSGILKPRTDARGPAINNSVELLDVKVGDRYFDNVGAGQQTSFITLPVGYETLVTWYHQDGQVYRQYKLVPDGIFGEHQDTFGVPCDVIAFARGNPKR